MRGAETQTTGEGQEAEAAAAARDAAGQCTDNKYVAYCCNSCCCTMVVFHNGGDDDDKVPVGCCRVKSNRKRALSKVVTVTGSTVEFPFNDVVDDDDVDVDK
jgi:hypothetical protein